MWGGKNRSENGKGMDAWAARHGTEKTWQTGQSKGKAAEMREGKSMEEWACDRGNNMLATANLENYAFLGYLRVCGL